MKKLLLLIVFVPVLAFGQKYELGVSGGFNYCAIPAISLSPVLSVDRNLGKGGYALGLSVTRNLYGKKTACPSVWQIGVKVEAQQIRARAMIYNPMIEWFVQPPRQFVHLAEPAISPVLFFNRKLNFAKSYFYIGINGGPAFTITNQAKSNYSNSYLPKGLGYTVGGQFGYSHKLSRRFSLNAELAVRYYNISINNTDYKTNPFEVKGWTDIVAPITIGLKYNIGPLGR